MSATSRRGKDARRVRLIFLCLCFSLALISGCETIVYWDNLPPLVTPRVVRITGDNEEIVRAVKIAQRLVDAAPFPAATIFVMTLTYFRTNLYSALPVFDLRARAFRCPLKGEKVEPTRPPSSACIVLPEEDLDRLSDDGLAALIAHELGHLDKGHKSWQGSAEPVLIQWEADEAAMNRLYLAGYCVGETLRKAGKEMASVYGPGGYHPWQGYPSDCKPKDFKDPAAVDKAVVFLKRGLTYYKISNYDGAIQEYDEAIRLKQDYAAAFYNRGRAYYGKRDYDRALADFNQAIQLNPNYASAFNSRGLVYNAKHDYNLAIREYDQAIRLDAKYSAAFNNRGNAYRRLGSYDSAIRDYDEAIRLNPNYARAFNNRGAAHREKKDYERALADYEAAVRFDPKIAQHRSMGVTLFYLGRIEESSEALKRAVKAAPQDAYAMLWRYLALGKENKADIAARELSENAARLAKPRWPAVVIDYYLGKIDEKKLYTATDDADPRRRSEQLCEANFYTGALKLLKQAPDEAIPLLRAAEKDCPSNFYESHGAMVELERLGL